MASSSSAPVYIHCGRGGWGNITTAQRTAKFNSSNQSSSPRSQPSPTAQARRFSTGIGGYANMVDPSHPQKPRAQSQASEDLQSLISSASSPGTSFPSSSATHSDYHIGIGGHSNTYRRVSEDIRLSRERKDSVSMESMSSGSKRGSVAESVKDFLGGSNRRGSRT